MQGRNATDKTGHYRVMDNRIKFRDNYKLFNTNFSYKKKKKFSKDHVIYEDIKNSLCNITKIFIFQVIL